jgi:hypothetical protein
MSRLISQVRPMSNLPCRGRRDRNVAHPLHENDINQKRVLVIVDQQHSPWSVRSIASFAECGCSR